MNLSSVMMPALRRRSAMAVVAAGTLLGSSCTLFPPPEAGPGTGGPPFAPAGSHRYGANGTQSPNYKDPRTVTGEREIKRDPNNDNINLEPPPPKSGNKPAENADRPPEAPPPPTNETPPPPPENKPAPVPVQDDLPYGIPVIGKPGMVYSPYAEDKGQVDAKGLKRGTRVKCPYTGRHFRVP